MAKNGAKAVAKNTYVKMEMEDGQTLDLTLTYIALLNLKRSHAEQYAEYNRIMTKGPQDEFDTLSIIYTAYLCGLIMQGEGTDDAMGYEEFISIVTPDREYIGNICKGLINPKKATASASLS